MCEQVRERECVCVKQERERECVCVCVQWETEREYVCTMRESVCQPMSQNKKTRTIVLTTNYDMYD